MGKHGNFKKADIKSSKNFEIKNQDRVDYNLKKPMFSFYHMRYGQPECLSTCEVPIKASVTNTLIRLSQFTWKDLGLNRKDALGFEIIPQKQFNVALPTPPITPEVDMMVFRHSRGGRIAGFREDNIYHILLVGNKLYKH
ncbi:MAG: hypothetical protein KKF30_02500 [Proteobacteria bacterium]|nr:hypothetical protein [Pseudomonadota bacterium]MBU4472184.1 hypothetical protein [Pseudomonadota bacterium]MCG2750393.1 hypothetical protein [Desulfobacteraceae bacterium]